MASSPEYSRKWYLEHKQEKAAYNRERSQRPEVVKRRRERYRAYYQRTPESFRRWQLWSAYRVTPERYEELLRLQDGKCVCGNVFRTDSRNKADTPHVDHDHRCCPGLKSCGECVRGLLCRNCNRALGLLKDSASVLRSLALWVDGGATRRA